MNKLKMFLLYIISSIMLGVLFGVCVSYIYTSSLEDKYFKYKIYLIKSGEYNSYNKMVSNSKSINYIYYKDNGKYNSIVGITMNEDNIDKIESLYSDKLDVVSLYTKDEELIEKIKDYDNKISNCDNLEEIKKINDEVLKIYKDSDYDIVSELS